MVVRGALHAPTSANRGVYPFRHVGFSKGEYVEVRCPYRQPSRVEENRITFSFECPKETKRFD